MISEHEQWPACVVPLNHLFGIVFSLSVSLSLTLCSLRFAPFGSENSVKGIRHDDVLERNKKMKKGVRPQNEMFCWNTKYFNFENLVETKTRQDEKEKNEFWFIRLRKWRICRSQNKTSLYAVWRMKVLEDRVHNCLGADD